MALDKRKYICLKCGEVYHEDAPTCKGCGGMCILASDEGLTAAVLLGKSNSGIRDEVVKANAKGSWEELVSAAQRMTQAHPSVLTPLGYCYLEGKGTAKDVEKALECFGKSVNCGDAEAAYALYTIFDSGNDIAPNWSIARHMLRLAATRGYKVAKVEYAKCLIAGAYGFDKDEVAAAKLLRDVGELGYHYLAKCYLYGDGVVQNVKEALRLFECDVNLGVRSNTVAMSALSLGKVYFLGDQVSKDLAQAEHWLNISREENDGNDAKFWLGQVYFELNRWPDAILLLSDASVLADDENGAQAKRILDVMLRGDEDGDEQDAATGQIDVMAIGYSLPETKSDPQCRLKPKAFLFDGVVVRQTKDWNDFFIAICEKLNAMDPVKFESLPTTAKMGIAFKLKRNAGKVDFRQTNFGVNHDVCVSKYAGASDLIAGHDGKTTLGRRMLELFNVDPNRITFTT